MYQPLKKKVLIGLSNFVKKKKKVDFFQLYALEDLRDILLIRLPESGNPQILYLAGFEHNQ